MPNHLIPVDPGARFGRLTVIRRDGNHPSSRSSVWLCRCDCGNEVRVTGTGLRLGGTRSCGCLAIDTTRARSVTRGQCREGRERTPEYGVWSNVLWRVKSPSGKNAPHYRDRGIEVCERWRSFELFYEDMGPRPSPRHSIDRIDNNRGYEPGNCRWATPVEQGRNRRSNHMVTVGGETLCVVEWAERSGLTANIIYTRLNRLHWSPEDAVSRKPRITNRRAA